MYPTREEVTKIWPVVETILTVPHTSHDYERLAQFLNELIDEVGEDESHPLASLMETLGTLVEAYEDQNVPEPAGDPISVLRTLMESHGVELADLPELGDQREASDILSGRRQLDVRQIKALSKRFHVSSAVFIAEE
ncbi:MAG: transcriptional regulator [Deltaproteobacteria bacterium]|nr:transcriptional regulator [Deltaproteobacteria bacterium]